jgi:hypothetical protein
MQMFATIDHLLNLFGGKRGINDTKFEQTERRLLQKEKKPILFINNRVWYSLKNGLPS